ncbi:MAG: tetratricopeptide repeat protein, partial [Chloroflexales bacterium]|nr:tetratricopeptide repeat protein [Chloroflexales bacterium]
CLAESLAHLRLDAYSRDRANALANLGALAYEQGQYAQAIEFHQISLQLQRELGDAYGVTRNLLNLGRPVLAQGDYLAAQSLLAEGLAQARALESPADEALFLVNLGLMAAYQMRLAEAAASIEEGLAIAQRRGDRWCQAQALRDLGLVSILQGDMPTATDRLNQSVQHLRVVEAWASLPECWERLAYAAIGQGQYQRALVLLSDAAELREKTGIARHPFESALYAQAWAALEAQGLGLECAVGCDTTSDVSLARRISPL